MPTLFRPESTEVDTLTDRYVHAVTRRLPADQCEDVARELDGSIAERVDAIAVSGRRHQARCDGGASDGSGAPSTRPRCCRSRRIRSYSAR